MVSNLLLKYFLKTMIMLSLQKIYYILKIIQNMSYCHVKFCMNRYNISGAPWFGCKYLAIAALGVLNSLILEWRRCKIKRGKSFIIK